MNYISKLTKNTLHMRFKSIKSVNGKNNTTWTIESTNVTCTPVDLLLMCKDYVEHNSGSCYINEQYGNTSICLNPSKVYIISDIMGETHTFIINETPNEFIDNLLCDIIDQLDACAEFGNPKMNNFEFKERRCQIKMIIDCIRNKLIEQKRNTAAVYSINPITLH